LENINLSSLRADCGRKLAIPNPSWILLSVFGKPGFQFLEFWGTLLSGRGLPEGTAYVFKPFNYPANQSSEGLKFVHIVPLSL
jgi:hypothetical protein